MSDVLTAVVPALVSGCLSVALAIYAGRRNAKAQARSEARTAAREERTEYEKSLLGKIDLLEARIATLNAELGKTTLALQSAEAKIDALERRIFELLDENLQLKRGRP